MMPPNTRPPTSSTGPVPPGYSPLPNTVQELLAGFPSLRKALDRLDAAAQRDLESRRRLLLLLAKWADTLPPPRGAIKDLRDFMQLRIELGSGACSGARRRRRRKTARKGPA
jgi:hypothetical protein